MYESQEGEAERLAELQRYFILDTLAEPAFDELALLASEACGTPTALVSLVDAERQWFKARVGMDACELPRDGAFCSYAILEEHLLIVEDATTDPRFSTSPLVTGQSGIRFYAGAVVRTQLGHALGTLCVVDRVPRQLTVAQRHILLLLAQQASRLLEMRQKVERFRRQTLLFENVQRAARIGGWELDLRTSLLSWTEETYRIHGLAAHRYQPTVESAVRFYKPAGRRKIAAAVKRLRAAGKPYDLELEIVTHGGEERWVRTLGHREDENGAPKRLYGTFQDVTERRLMEQAVRNAAQEERERFGYALHDGIGQELTGTALMLQALAGRAQTSDPGLAEELRHATGLVNQSLQSCRALAHQVTPASPTRGGLENALRSLGARTRRSAGIEVAIECDSVPGVSVDTVISDHLYLIAQEALTNAVKHSHASRIVIKLAVHSEAIHLQVRDDGRGGAAEGNHAGMGIKIMQHRARAVDARLEISGGEGGGTSVTCVLERPLAS
jgi:signal transduction histidine kinase